MILTLRIECVDGAYLRERCVRVLEIEEVATLDELHCAVQHEVRFDCDHPYQFFIANSLMGVKRRYLSQNEEWELMEEDFKKVTMAQVFPLGRRRLYYHFDFGDDWVFEIRKVGAAKEPSPHARYPRVIESIGPAPLQYPNLDAT